MAAPFATKRDLGNGLVLTFEWHGGEYIEVSAAHVHGSSEVINVWSASTDAPRIDRTDEAFQEKVDDWISSYPRDSLIHDALNNW